MNRSSSNPNLTAPCAVFLLVVEFCMGGAMAATHLPRIAVVADANQRMHFATPDGRAFIPQGVNWVIVSPGTEKTQRNISFNPDYYPAHKAEIHQGLREMAQDGFNFVRIRLDADAVAADTKKPILNRAYMANVIDFVSTAAANGLYTELTGQWLPRNYYQHSSRNGLPEPDWKNTSGINTLLLSRGLSFAYGRYIGDVLGAIKKANPELLSAIFCVDLWNELAFESGYLPFSKEAGQFVSEDRTIVDMSDPEARQKLVDEATVQWINGAIAAAKKSAPDTLFTSSVFSPTDVDRSGYTGVYARDAKWGDPRQPLRLRAIEQSKVDFLEIHLYPRGPGASLDVQIAALEYSPHQEHKPILLAETGAFKSVIGDPEMAAHTVKGIVRQACALHFSGWAYWTWNADEQKDLWNLKENGGFLARRLSPKYFVWCSD